MRLKEENPELNGIVKSYNLRGFSFREYLNMKTGLNLKSYSLEDIMQHHGQLAADICRQVNPLDHFRSYIHHG
jgi:predicted AAA+ superfamily ATPase